MRLIFLGSGEFGLPTLQQLAAQHQVALVVTQPDRPAGRRRQLTPTPVAAWAQAQGLPVLKAQDVNEPQVIEQIAGHQPDASIVIAFGQKLSPQLISVLGRLAVNLHASLLPKYRGAAPINWALINNEKTTGVTVIGLAQRMDAGEIYDQAELAIDPSWTAGELHDQLAQLGPQVIGRVLDQLEQGRLQPRPQDESQATKAPKLTKADGTVDFNQPAEMVRARVHGLTPWPGCRVRWRSGADSDQVRELILHRVEAIDPLPEFLRRRLEDAAPSQPQPGEMLDMLMVMANPGVVRLLELQAPGTRVMKADAFARGYHLSPGDRLEPL